MKRLLIISLNGDPLGEYGTEHAGGQVKYILELGRYLVREGWQIDVYTIRNNNLPVYQEITEGFNVMRFALPHDRCYSYDVTTPDIQFLQSNILRFILDKNYQYSVVLCCYWLSGLVGISIREVFKRKVILSFCSLGYYKQIALGDSHKLKERIDAEIMIANSSDHIIATTYAEKAILVSYYNADAQKISVIPRGVDLDVFYKF